MAENEQLLTIKDLAEYLQVSQRTIYRLIKKRNIPYLKVGNQWRFRKQMIEEWLEGEQRVPEEKGETA